MSSEEPEPFSSTLTGKIFASGATPTTPTPLPRTAAMVPATWVPCSSPLFCPSGPRKSPLPQGR